jgi:type I restriction enzyme S subunit
VRTVVQLGDLADIVRGISFPKEAKSLEQRDGDVACLRTTNVQKQVEWGDLWFVPAEHVKRAEQYVRAGDILISTANSYELVGKVAPVVAIPHKATLGAFISLIRPRPSVEPKYLYHQLAWGKTQSRIRETASTTTNISNVSTRKLMALEFSVPPIEEQRSAVAEIEKQFSRLDEAIAGLKRVKANLKRYVKATIESLTNVSSSPSQAEQTISDIARSLDNLRRPVNKTERAKRPGKVPYLGANGQTGWIDEHLFDEELVLVVEDETFVGRTTPFSYYFAGKCWVNNHTHVLRARTDQVTAKYLNLALSYYPFIPLTTGSTGRRKLTKAALMSAPISVPPLAEQHRIVAEVDRLLSIAREAEAEVETNLKRAQALRQTILSKAFTTSQGMSQA